MLFDPHSSKTTAKETYNQKETTGSRIDLRVARRILP